MELSSIGLLDLQHCYGNANKRRSDAKIIIIFVWLFSSQTILLLLCFFLSILNSLPNIFICCALGSSYCHLKFVCVFVMNFLFNFFFLAILQGNRVSTESDTITIRIGGIDECGNEIDHSSATKATQPNSKQQPTKSTRWKRAKRNKSSIANNRISTTNCKWKICIHTQHRCDCVARMKGLSCQSFQF